MIIYINIGLDNIREKKEKKKKEKRINTFGDVCWIIGKYYLIVLTGYLLTLILM
jgi:hypothetical protein